VRIVLASVSDLGPERYHGRITLSPGMNCL
jgi:hypothetical protein